LFEGRWIPDAGEIISAAVSFMDVFAGNLKLSRSKEEA
jgi:hypothetical protein